MKVGLGPIRHRDAEGQAAMIDPQELYEFTRERPAWQGTLRPVLVHLLEGFVDAGAAGRLAARHLLDRCDPQPLARFDPDRLYDYRSRRPVMTFDEDHWVDYAVPELTLYELRDATGTPFLLLHGFEPDYAWEACTAAVRRIVEQLDVRLVVGANAIPMAVPHTRPLGVSAHATRAELVAERRPWIGKVQVPGHLAGLLEFRLGEHGHDAAGFAVHVPHYLTQTEYPSAAVVVVDALARAAGLALSVEELRASALVADASVEEQVTRQPEVAGLISALEQQYDAFVGAQTRGPLPMGESDRLPDAEELGAQFEQFLAEENERRATGDG